jgi:hypothetical protein
MMNKRMERSLLNFEPQNNRICEIRLKESFRNITVISAHSSTNDKDDQEKERLYENLEETCNRIPRHDTVIIIIIIIIIMGNFNPLNPELNPIC